MFLDNFLAFQGTGGVGQWTTAQTASTSGDASNVIDVMGTAWVSYSTQAGTPAIVTQYGARSGGMDYGNGLGKDAPWFYFTVVGAPTAAATTFQPYIQAAPDSASGTYPTSDTHAPGTYSVIWNGPAFTATALSKAGRFYIAPLPPAWTASNTTSPFLVPTVAPRFYKLSWTCSSTITSLTLLAGLVVDPTSFPVAPYEYNLNYTVI